MPVATTDRETARLHMPDTMRRDVRLLGDLLGEVLQEYGGRELLDDVERLRRTVIAVREGEAEPEDAETLVHSWPPERAESVARAFTVYFHLVNLAEEHQRIRAIGQRDRPGEPAPESLAATVADMRGPDGAGDDSALREALEGLELHPVLTAHPTEARRRAVVTAIQRLSALLSRYDDPRASATEQSRVRRGLVEEIDVLWRTAQLRRSKPDPLDEIRTAMAVFDETLFHVVPTIYRTLDEAVSPDDAGARPPLAPPYLRFGSWIGADRDGNPYVTAQTTREAMAIQAEHVLRQLEDATTRIGRTLTVAADTTPPSAALRRELGAAEAAHPELFADIAKRSPAEPHRQLVLYAAARVQATRLRDADLAYGRAHDLVADLRTVQESLAAAGAVRQAYGQLQHLVWQVETFGFHLAELEVRQHSAVHERALAEVRADPEQIGAETEEVLATLRVMAVLQERFGVDACRRYVISFTRTADDIAAVHELAGHAVGSGPPPVLDVVPLFESSDDLRRAPETLEAMVSLPAVRRRLDETGRRLEVMLGYSDSAKELGPAGATLALFDAQAELADWARHHDIRLVLFHGRGGALGRGGGPANRAVLAQAPGSVAGRLKVTEQGEVIFARYGHEAIARRHLEQVSSAVLLASSPAAEQRTANAAARFRELAERVSAAAEDAFRSLVESEGFADWFARVSPLDEIGQLGLGSRPASRGKRTRDLDDLRAIPWVFAWSQTRLNLPGWYGIGSGLAAVDDMDALRQAYEQWPLLAVMLDNAEMSLAKTDRGIATRYLALGDRPELTDRVLAEYDRTVDGVLAVTGHDRLLQNRRVLSRAVELRDPYVDALSHLQLRALRGLRPSGEITEDGEGDGERLRDLLLLTVNGVSAGLQNTG